MRRALVILAAVSSCRSEQPRKACVYPDARGTFSAVVDGVPHDFAPDGLTVQTPPGGTLLQVLGGARHPPPAHRKLYVFIPDRVSGHYRCGEGLDLQYFPTEVVAQPYGTHDGFSGVMGGGTCELTLSAQGGRFEARFAGTLRRRRDGASVALQDGSFSVERCPQQD